MSVQLLDESYFQDVEKIKTMGSSYMAASGLSPDRQVSGGVPFLRRRHPQRRPLAPVSLILPSRASRRARTAGSTSASWFCSPFPCRRRSNTSTRTRETASSCEWVRTPPGETRRLSNQERCWKNEAEPPLRILRFSPVSLQSQMN